METSVKSAAYAQAPHPEERSPCAASRRVRGGDVGFSAVHLTYSQCATDRQLLRVASRIVSRQKQGRIIPPPCGEGGAKRRVGVAKGGNPHRICTGAGRKFLPSTLTLLAQMPWTAPHGRLIVKILFGSSTTGPALWLPLSPSRPSP